MNPSRKKELINRYKQRDAAGGIYAIGCKATQNRIIEMTTDLAGAENRFQFSLRTKTCPHYLMQSDWAVHGADSFYFEMVESLPQKPEEDAADYKASLEVLRDMLREKQ